MAMPQRGAMARALQARSAQPSGQGQQPRDVARRRFEAHRRAMRERARQMEDESSGSSESDSDSEDSADAVPVEEESPVETGTRVFRAFLTSVARNEEHVVYEFTDAREFLGAGHSFGDLAQVYTNVMMDARTHGVPLEQFFYEAVAGGGVGDIDEFRRLLGTLNASFQNFAFGDRPALDMPAIYKAYHRSRLKGITESEALCFDPSTGDLTSEFKSYAWVVYWTVWEIGRIAVEPWPDPLPVAARVRAEMDDVRTVVNLDRQQIATYIAWGLTTPPGYLMRYQKRTGRRGVGTENYVAVVREVDGMAATADLEEQIKGGIVGRPGGHVAGDVGMQVACLRKVFSHAPLAQVYKKQRRGEWDKEHFVVNVEEVIVGLLRAIPPGTEPTRLSYVFFSSGKFYVADLASPVQSLPRPCYGPFARIEEAFVVCGLVEARR